MNLEFYDIDDLNIPEVVVIYAKYNNKVVMCKHKKRETWELPGGHIEKNETPQMAARRELYEETGATKFDLEAVCKYSFECGEKKIFSILYTSNIKSMEKLPDFKIKEVKLFEEIPNNVTYPEIYEKILTRVRNNSLIRND